ncbi:MAG: hypothetical protein V1495_10105 [Pseudomonadota bacterium]
MHGELTCEGKIHLGPLSAETRRRLSELRGDWLEYSSADDTVVGRHVQPTGCPALSAVPCELIAMLGILTPSEREKSAGGEFRLWGHEGSWVRVLAEKGEVRIQWPHLDYSKTVPVPAEKAMAGINAHEARIRGWVRFRGGKREIQSISDLLDRFEGLYPEGEIVSAVTGETVRIEFKDVNIGPRELLGAFREIVQLETSLDGELDVGSFVRDLESNDFRIVIRRGSVEMVRPSIWRG